MSANLLLLFNAIGGGFLAWQLNVILNTDKIIKQRTKNDHNDGEKELNWSNFHYPLFTVWIIIGFVTISGPLFLAHAILTWVVYKKILKKNPLSSPKYFYALRLISIITLFYMSLVMANQIRWRVDVWELIRTALG